MRITFVTLQFLGRAVQNDQNTPTVWLKSQIYKKMLVFPTIKINRSDVPYVISTYVT
jgi:hypothetical protein